MQLDAGGKIPFPKTKFENKWVELINSNKLNQRFNRLLKLQKMNLSDKIKLSYKMISEWYEAWEGNVAISFSGGKDSTVLLHLVRSLYPNIQAVFVNTGLEYPELVNFVKKTPNTTIIKPKISFNKCIKKYGYPLISKKVARGVHTIRHPTSKNANIRRLYNEGINRFGEPCSGFKIPLRWRFLIDAPFEISDKCCSVMKKDPINKFNKKTGKHQFVGILAEDSKQRQKSYLQHGCNAFDTKNPVSWPLGFWTSQDILHYLSKNNIPTANIYGNIYKDKQSKKYKTSGVNSTGCVFCAFGVHMEETPNRFQQMHKTHPALWKYTAYNLGLKKIFDYVKSNCPNNKIKTRFNLNPQTTKTQLKLF